MNSFGATYGYSVWKNFYQILHKGVQKKNMYSSDFLLVKQHKKDYFNLTMRNIERKIEIERGRAILLRTSWDSIHEVHHR